MKFSDLLEGEDGQDGYAVTIPEEWAQGRTAYGGLTAAFCAEAAGRAEPGLPPLRSVQVAFVGPASGRVEASTRVLRRGKSTAFIEADLEGEKGLATRGTFVYGMARESGVRLEDYPMPDVPGFAACEEAAFTEHHPAFLKNFEIRPAGGGLPFGGRGAPFMTWWIRHRDEAVRETATGLLALGDVTPPAVAPLMKTVAPVSSVTWQQDFLTDDFSTRDGWFLLHSHAQAGADGWSGQDMGIWTSDGRPVAAGRQTVLIFG